MANPGPETVRFMCIDKPDVIVSAALASRIPGAKQKLDACTRQTQTFNITVPYPSVVVKTITDWMSKSDQVGDDYLPLENPFLPEGSDEDLISYLPALLYFGQEKEAHKVASRIVVGFGMNPPARIAIILGAVNTFTDGEERQLQDDEDGFDLN